MSAHVVTTSDGIIIGLIDENCDVLSIVTNQKIATLAEGGNLCSPDGQSLNLHLETVNGGKLAVGRGG